VSVAAGAKKCRVATQKLVPQGIDEMREHSSGQMCLAKWSNCLKRDMNLTNDSVRTCLEFFFLLLYPRALSALRADTPRPYKIGHF
jgi:hypothetical protein